MKAKIKINPDEETISSFDSNLNMSDDFKTSEDTEVIETEFMTASKRAIIFDSGIVIHVKMNAKCDYSFYAESNEPVFKITFSLADTITRTLESDLTREQISKNTYNAYYFSEPKGYWDLEKEKSYETVELVFTKPQILFLISKYASHLVNLKQLIETKTYMRMYAQNLPINQELNGLIKDLLNYNNKENWKRLALESALLRIIMLTLDEAISPKSIAECVKEIIERNLRNIPTISELCRFFGVNEKLLQRKFKEEYGSTVNEFAHSLKMQKAKEELQCGKPIKEVSFLSGYQNISHFSRAFKKHWGVTPREI